MAKIVSPVWSIIRGSIGGTTYFAGPGGQILARARTAPVDPGSLFQTIMRSSFNYAAGLWDALTVGNQILWNTYASQLTIPKATGNYTPTGRQMFMAGIALQKYMDTRGLVTPTEVTSPPATTGFLLPSNLSMAAPSGIGTGFALNITADPTDDTTVMMNVAGPFDKERYFWKGPWDTSIAVGSIVPGGTSVQIDRLGLQVGRIYFIRVKCVADDASPRVSAEFFLRGEAITNP